MHNQFFEEGQSPVIQFRFWKWFFQWINYPQENPQLFHKAASLLDAMLQKHRPAQYDSLTILENVTPEGWILIINERIALCLVMKSLTFAERRNLAILKKQIFLQESEDFLGIPEQIIFVYFEPTLPMFAIHAQSSETERYAIDEKKKELEQLIDQFPEQEEAMCQTAFPVWYNEALTLEENFSQLELPVNQIFTLKDLVCLLGEGDVPQNSIYLDFLAFLQKQQAQPKEESLSNLKEWSDTSFRAFMRWIEDNYLPDCEWGSRRSVSGTVWCLWWHSLAYRVPGDQPFRNICLQLELEPEIERSEILIKAVCNKKRTIPTETLWDIFHRLEPLLQEQGLPYYKKRFLPDAHSPILAVPFSIEHCGDLINKLDRALDCLHFETDE